MTVGDSSDDIGSKTQVNQTGASDLAPAPLVWTDSQKTESDQLMLMFLALESTGNGLVITNPKISDNPIVHVNQVFVDRCGFHLNQILGQNCRFLQQGDRQQESIGQVRSAIREQRPIETIFRNYRKDGSLYLTELTIAPVHDSKGVLASYVGIQYDVDARHLAERRISECYSVLSHELRTPVSSVSAALHLLNDGTGGKIAPRARELLRSAEESCNKLGQLIAEILDWKQNDAAHLRLNKSRSRISSIVEAAKRELKPLAQHCRVELVSEIVGDTILTVDKNRLKKVIVTLATMAIRSSPVDGKVLVRVERIADVLISFTIQGEVDESTFIQLMEIARRSNSESVDTVNTSKRGTELDLAICGALVELHQSQLKVSSAGPNQIRYSFDIIEAKNARS
jgi:PAS domain S-box-containing protein